MRAHFRSLRDLKDPRGSFRERHRSPKSSQKSPEGQTMTVEVFFIQAGSPVGFAKVVFGVVLADPPRDTLGNIPRGPSGGAPGGSPGDSPGGTPGDSRGDPPRESPRDTREIPRRLRRDATGVREKSLGAICRAHCPPEESRAKGSIQEGHGHPFGRPKGR